MADRTLDKQGEILYEIQDTLNKIWRHMQLNDPPTQVAAENHKNSHHQFTAISPMESIAMAPEDVELKTTELKSSSASIEHETEIVDASGVGCRSQSIGDEQLESCEKSDDQHSENDADIVAIDSKACVDSSQTQQLVAETKRQESSIVLAEEGPREKIAHQLYETKVAVLAGDFTVVQTLRYLANLVNLATVVFALEKELKWKGIIEYKLSKLAAIIMVFDPGGSLLVFHFLTKWRNMLIACLAVLSISIHFLLSWFLTEKFRFWLNGAIWCWAIWYNTVLMILTRNMKNAKVSIDALFIYLNTNGWEIRIVLGFSTATIMKVANKLKLRRGSSKDAKFSIEQKDSIIVLDVYAVRFEFCCTLQKLRIVRRRISAVNGVSNIHVWFGVLSPINLVGFYHMTKPALNSCSKETSFLGKKFSNIKVSHAILLVGVGMMTVIKLQLYALDSFLSFLELLSLSLYNNSIKSFHHEHVYVSLAETIILNFVLGVGILVGINWTDFIAIEFNLEDKVILKEGVLIQTKTARPNKPNIEFRSPFEIGGFEPNSESNSTQFIGSLSGGRIQRREGQEALNIFYWPSQIDIHSTIL